MTQNFKGIVKLSEENYIILSTTGTLTLKDGTILTYDPSGTVYITPDASNYATMDDLPTIIDFEAIENDIVYRTVILDDGTQAIYFTGDELYGNGVDVVGEILNNGTQAIKVTEQEI